MLLCLLIGMKIWSMSHNDCNGHFAEAMNIACHSVFIAKVMTVLLD